MEQQKKHHRLFHGTLEPDKEINIPVNSRRRRSARQSSIRESSINRSQPKHTPLSREQLRKEKRKCPWCQLANFSTHELYPITINNDVDEATLPRKFEFIDQSILCEGVEAADDDFRTGCECKRDEDCERRGCNCLQDMNFRQETPGPRAKVYAYIPRGVDKDCLRLPILESRDPIYECHDKCDCSINCSNRVVERGRRVPLEIFRTSDGRGWGVRSSVDIQQGQYVDKYVGEIITAAEAQRRREVSDIAQRKDVYLFALDKFSDKDSMDPRLSGPPFEVDGEFKSGPTRFINHSCDPNLRSFARVGDHADKHLHDLALFAIRDIPAGEELTFDYVDGEDIDLLEDSNDPKKRKDMEGCCASTHSSPSSPYPTAAHPTSSSRAINTSQPVSHTALPRPSTTHTNTSSQHAQHTHPALTERFNRPLRPHIWTSKSRRWTRHGLDREREEFFDTRVTGRPEIWMTLKAALEVLWAGGEGGDVGGIATAQTILEAADVTLPTGDMANGAYDAFGALYSLPEWVVSDPENMLGDDDEVDKGLSRELDDPRAEEEEAARRREEKGKAVLAIADMIAVKARLSDRGGADVVVHVGKGDSVRLLTKRIFEESGLPPSKRIKIVYLGKLLKENESLLSQGWKEDHIINALVFD